MSKSPTAMHLSAIAAIERQDFRKGAELGAQAIDADPSIAGGYSNLGIALGEMGQYDGMFDAFRTALHLDPTHPQARRNLLTMTGYMGDMTPHDRYAAIRKLTEPFNAIKPMASHNQERFQHGRERFRVGLVSSDFYNHPVGLSAVPLFSPLPLEIYVYSDVARPDALTAFVKSNTAQWRDVRGIEDRMVAELIHQDQIDVLLFLGGWYDLNRPQIACYRPAPVQAALYAGSTLGLDAIDYWIGDPVISPGGDIELFSEALEYLPCWTCYSTERGAPPVAEAPVLRNGYITFGMLNRSNKVTRGAITLWAQVLKAVPGSKLIMKYRDTFQDPALRARMRTMFGAEGIDPGRLSFPKVTYSDAWALIDINLDPIAFSGATTTFNALWAGVPTVTLKGPLSVQRAGASLLTMIEYEGCIVDTHKEYVSRARAFAEEIGFLKSFRKTTRDRVITSPLCDSPAYAQAFANCIQSMWDRSMS